MKLNRYSGEYHNVVRAHNLAIAEGLMVRMGWNPLKSCFWLEYWGEAKAFTVFKTSHE